MTIHPSLRSGSLKKHRSVLKRHERLKTLKDEEKWKEGDSALGLPKIKTLRLKVKKGKAAEAAPAAEEAAAAAAEEKGTEAPARTPRQKETEGKK